MDDFLGKLCCCCSVEIGGYIVSILEIFGSAYSAYDDSKETKRGFDHHADFVGKGKKEESI
jgi:hypothetical protein